MLEEAPEKSAKEKRKRKKEKERDGSRAEEGLATTAGRRVTSQPVTGDEQTGSNISRVCAFQVSVSFDLMELLGCEGGGAAR